MVQSAAMGRLVKGVGRVVKGPVLDARAEANTILEAARRQAAEVLAAAAADAERVRGEARAAGMAEARAEAAAMMVSARADAEQVRQEARETALALAARIATKIAGRTIALDPAVVVDIAEQSLAECRAREGRVVLRVHPDELATIQRQRPRLASRLEAAAELELIADPEIAPRGCVVETPIGRVDAQLATQLDALERALLQDG